MASDSLHDLLRGDAVPAPAPEGRGVVLAASYQDPLAELEAARTGCALVDATARGRLRFTGADAVDLLQRMLAGHVQSIAAGRIAENLLLTPKGRVRFAFTLEREAQAVLLRTSPGDAGPLAAALDAFVFAEDVTASDESEASAPLELFGPTASAVLAGLLPDAAALEPGATCTASSWQGGPVWAARTRVLGRDGWRLDPGAEHAAALWSDLAAAGATPVGLQVREILRLEAGAALAGVELPADDEGAPYPQEAGLDAAFALDKGCYVGQEVVAKLDTYGGLNRRLTAFALADPSASVPAPGSPLTTAAGEEAGTITSIARPPASGQQETLLLAYLKLRHEDAGPFHAGPGGPALRVLELAV